MVKMWYGEDVVWLVGEDVVWWEIVRGSIIFTWLSYHLQGFDSEEVCKTDHVMVNSK